MNLDRLITFCQSNDRAEPYRGEFRSSYEVLKHAGERYEIGPLIGSGALKAVYRAYDRKGQRWIAYACLMEEAQTEEYVELLIQEAWLTSCLNHPNIIKVHDVGINEREQAFFTMDLRTGQSMYEMQQAGGSLDQLVHCYRSVLRAIEYAHEEGVLHLDLKPDNIQCDGDGQAIVCDWGLGTHTQFVLENDEMNPDTAHLEQNKTLVGIIKGSPGFMAPEQAMPSNVEHVIKGEHTDIYSLGAMLYFILSGKPPYSGELEGVLERTVKGEYELYEPETERHASLWAISKKAMSLGVEDRYKSVKALREDLERYLDGGIPLAEKATRMKRVRYFCGRNQRGIIVGLLILVLFLVCGGVVNAYLDSREALSDKEEEVEHYAAQSQEFYEDFLGVEQDYKEYLQMNTQVYDRSAYMATRVGRYLARSVYSQDHNRRRYTKDNRDILTSYQASLNLLKTTFKLHNDAPREDAIKAWLEVCFTMLNFVDILESEIEFEDGLSALYLEYARKYPSFGVYERDRPALADLERFFKDVSADSRISAPMLELIFRFQWAAQVSILGESSNHLVRDTMCRANFKDESFEVTSLEEGAEVVVATTAENPVFQSLLSSHYSSLLSYYQTETLVVNTPNASFDLAWLNGCTAQVVDLSNVRHVHASMPWESSSLKSVILSHSPQDSALESSIVKSLLQQDIQVEWCEGRTSDESSQKN